MVEEEVMGRMRIPRSDEIVGTVEAMVGGSRMVVSCSDGKERTCRIPGKIRRRIWVKEGDTVIVKPWCIEGDKKGDIMWRYTKLQAGWLRRKGHIK
ncbi:MAG: translation initiation factor eIF-1A [Candidatus Micrarchaeota archaeon]|nr:translation initiation factor eIF-1A [Candidatus Micrarchaeota archaeon]